MRQTNALLTYLCLAGWLLVIIKSNFTLNKNSGVDSVRKEVEFFVVVREITQCILSQIPCEYYGFVKNSAQVFMTTWVNRFANAADIAIEVAENTTWRVSFNKGGYPTPKVHGGWLKNLSTVSVKSSITSRTINRGEVKESPDLSDQNDPTKIATPHHSYVQLAFSFSPSVGIVILLGSSLLPSPSSCTKVVSPFPMSMQNPLRHQKNPRLVTNPFIFVLFAVFLILVLSCTLVDDMHLTSFRHRYEQPLPPLIKT
ncbi:hypothetical protein VNO77_15835 [Canavalia gladiata]|uniref:Uncharacterized protein n=1 Tax=Canavalia gladiata TaxID=3824 RepID=A0AAN9LZW4_CANGL